MITTQEITETIFAAMDEVNQLLPSQQRLEKAPDTILVGTAGVLDSLGLINLIVALEQGIESRFDRTIALADDLALSVEATPLATVATLAEHLYGLLEE